MRLNKTYEKNRNAGVELWRNSRVIINFKRDE